MRHPSCAALTLVPLYEELHHPVVLGSSDEAGGLKNAIDDFWEILLRQASFIFAVPASMFAQQRGVLQGVCVHPTRPLQRKLLLSLRRMFPSCVFISTRV